VGGLLRVEPSGEGGGRTEAFASLGRDADVFGAGNGGAFVGGAGFPDHVVEGEAVFRETRWRDLDSKFVAAEERAQVGGLAFGNGDDEAVVGEKRRERDAGGSEGLLVGLVADGKVTCEEDYTGGIGVGEVNGAGVGKGHGGYH